MSGQGVSRGLYTKNPGSVVSFQGSKPNGLGGSDAVKEVGKIQNSAVLAKRSLNLTPKQMEERRLKNLCFWCEGKFTPNHRCKNR